MSLQELVFVPIHDEIKEHWTLAVICFPGLVVLPTAADGEGTEGGCAEGGGGGEGDLPAEQ
jgi:Ulp1 family protease